MTGKPKLNGTIKLTLSIISIAIVLIGVVFGIGVSWASVGRIDDKVDGVCEDVADHEIRVRAVEEAVIRTDVRLGNIEEGIDEIKAELRDDP